MHIEQSEGCVEQYLLWFEPQTYPVDMYDMQKAENILKDALFQLVGAYISTEKKYIFLMTLCLLTWLKFHGKNQFFKTSIHGHF